VAEAMTACVLADTLSRQAGIARVQPTADEWALEIDRCDEALLAALARRVEVSAARDRALNAAAPKQRKTVVGPRALRSAWARRARELGLPRDLVLSILEAILRPSEG
jgi:chorismate mutase